MNSKKVQSSEFRVFGKGEQPPSPPFPLPSECFRTGHQGRRLLSATHMVRNRHLRVVVHIFQIRRGPSGLVIRRHPFMAGGTPTTTWPGCPGGSTWGIMGESKVVKPGQGGIKVTGVWHFFMHEPIVQSSALSLLAGRTFGMPPVACGNCPCAVPP
ncbi:MAG: hypothetical protein JWR19_1969, partial [Pedosphaera sp.]|nr:hypothetical protein [Pedosphaera sp.]